MTSNVRMLLIELYLTEQQGNSVKQYLLDQLNTVRVQYYHRALI